LSWLEVVVLSLVEGLTEFLPVSSTGHLILTSAFFGISEEGFVKSFNIIIQSGAILSVLVLYWRRFLPNMEFYKKIIVAFLPAAIIGLLVKKKIDLLLDSVLVVSISLILGGLILIWADRWFESHRKAPKAIAELSLKDCLLLGLIQCFAFIPGVSRAGATILGGLALGLSKKEAAEFSFFLAVPTLVGASAVKGLGLWGSITPEQWSPLIAGILLSFIFATLAIRFFLKLLEKFGLKHFGYYRIAIGVLCLILLQQGLIL
jgi:undecaprenyl-diphosphatase